MYWTYSWEAPTKLITMPNESIAVHAETRSIRPTRNSPTLTNPSVGSIRPATITKTKQAA